MESKSIRLNSIWSKPDNPHATCGVAELQREVRKRGWDDITPDEVEDYLASKRAYTLHKVARKTFPRRRVLAPAPRVIMGADLADMSKLASENEGVRYLLVCLDVYSRYMHVEVLKDKRGSTCTRAMARILTKPECRGYRRLWTDRGSEFLNRDMDKLLKEKRIKIYHTESHEIKVSLVERAIRTLKGRIYRYLTEHGTLQYVDALPEMVEAYNKRPHRGLLQVTPQEAHGHSRNGDTRQHFQRVHEAWYKKVTRRACRPTLAVGEVVRVSREAQAFSRGFLYQNSEELFTISSIDTSKQPVVGYYLRDLDGQELKGIFYREELVKAKLPTVYAVDVIGERTRKKVKEVLVHYRGYNARHDRWIPRSELESTAQVS